MVHVLARLLTTTTLEVLGAVAVVVAIGGLAGPAWALLAAGCGAILLAAAIDARRAAAVAMAAAQAESEST